MIIHVISTILAYILLIPCCWVFSNWIFVHCANMGGGEINYPEHLSMSFAAAIPLTIACLRVIFKQ